MASPLAGSAGVARWQFILLDVTGALAWSGTWMGLGYAFSEALDAMAAWVARLGGHALLLAGAALAVYVALTYAKRRRIFRELRMVRITPDELRHRLDAGDTDLAIIDTRSELDVKQVPYLIPGAIRIDADEVERRRAELPRDREIVLSCTRPNEATSARVALRLNRNGLPRVRPLLGGPGSMDGATVPGRQRPGLGAARPEIDRHDRQLTRQNPVTGSGRPKEVTNLVRLFGSAALFAALSGLAACNRSPDVSATPKPPSVTVVAVAQRPVPVYGQYVGQAEAVKTVEVRARVEGFIERQVAADGADVKAGDLLFVIDPRPFEANLRQAEANVARDTAQLHQTEAALTQREADVRQAQANVERDLAQVENARTQEGRYRTLLQQELIAREQYDQIRTNMTALEATVQADRAALENARAALAAARATIENARAAVRADEAAVDSARLQLGYTSVRSPLDGRMGRAEVRVGALVGKGEATLLATVSTLDPMYVSFSVSEREALSVWGRGRSPGGRASPGSSGITITLPDDRVYSHDGRLDFVDRAVDPRTGTLALRAAFPNPARMLQPGQYVRLRILLSERPDALVVPQAAVQESQGSASLFVVGPDRTVQTRHVQMGPRFGTLWVVEDGVKVGEQVVVKGLQRVRPGLRVEPTVEALPAATGG